MSKYPDDLAEQAYYDEILGPPPEPPEINDLPSDAKYVGIDKPKVEHHKPDNEIEGFGEVPF